MALKYTAVHVAPRLAGDTFEVGYFEFDGENVVRKVEVLPDGTRWRQSVDCHWNPVPGSLCHTPALLPERAEALILDGVLDAVRWSSAEEFEAMWDKATRSPWGRVEDLKVLPGDE